MRHAMIALGVLGAVVTQAEATRTLAVGLCLDALERATQQPMLVARKLHLDVEASCQTDPLGTLYRLQGQLFPPPATEKRR